MPRRFFQVAAGSYCHICMLLQEELLEQFHFGCQPHTERLKHNFLRFDDLTGEGRTHRGLGSMKNIEMGRMRGYFP